MEKVNKPQGNIPVALRRTSQTGLTSYNSSIPNHSYYTTNVSSTGSESKQAPIRPRNISGEPLSVKKAMRGREFEQMLENSGFTVDHQTGSHVIWKNEDESKIFTSSLHNPKYNVPIYQQKQLLALISNLNSTTPLESKKTQEDDKSSNLLFYIEYE